MRTTFSLSGLNVRHLARASFAVKPRGNQSELALASRGRNVVKDLAKLLWYMFLVGTTPDAWPVPRPKQREGRRDGEAVPLSGLVTNGVSCSSLRTDG